MEQNRKNDSPARLRKQFGRLKEVRRDWEPVWRDCYAHALPLRSGFASPSTRTADPLFDGTAPDAVDQLAASLLAELTPPWSRWFNLTAGADLPPDEAAAAGPVLEDIGATLQGHFDRSNFLVEMHQCYLDLVTGGTAALLFEESAPGGASAFRFRALPLPEVWLDEGETGRLETVFRRTALPLESFVRRFPEALLSPDEARAREKGDDLRIAVIEATRRRDGKVRYAAFREDPPESRADTGAAGRDAAEKPLAAGTFADHPVIAFRWMKAPGEAWGRSPVMKALPDNPYGLPEFPARGAFLLPPEVVKKIPRLRTEYVRSRLKKMANTESGKKELKDMGFTPEQIATMKTKVNLKNMGIHIHEDYRVGRMLLVDERIHRLAHQGGRSIW